MIKQHLRVLARELDRLPARWKHTPKSKLSSVVAFSMSFWRMDRAYVDVASDVSGPPECGTVACAAGLAGELPYFQERGFSISYHDSPLFVDPKTGASHTVRSLEKFFGISTAQADYLFTPGSYPPHEIKNPRYAAKRIRKFIRDNGLPRGRPRSKGTNDLAA